MAKPKFYLETRKSLSDDAATKKAINMFYSIGQGKRLQYYTGIRIDVKHFRKECNTSNSIKPIKTIAPYAEQDNNKLAQIAQDAVTIMSSVKASDRTVQYLRAQLDILHKPKMITSAPMPDFVGFFEELIKKTKEGKRLIQNGNNKGSRYSFNSVKNYGITLSSIKRFLAFHKMETIALSNIDQMFYEDFRHYCYEIEQKERSTFAGYIKDIKTVMLESKTPGFPASTFIMPSYEADTLYLSTDQINIIANLDFSDRTQSFKLKRKSGIENISYQVLDKVRDLFLIGCYTGARFSDLSILELKSVSEEFITLKQVKTKSRVTIPIMKRLRPILAKYPEALPTMSNQKFNDYIKCVGELAGLDEQITVKNTKGNILNEDTKPLYSIITSHCCRRSYATNMFRAGIPPMLIMAATGHKTETSFLKYIRASSDDKARLLSDMLQKLNM